MGWSGNDSVEWAKKTLWGDENVLKRMLGDDCTLCKYSKALSTQHRWIFQFIKYTSIKVFFKKKNLKYII